jgi:hypothetical protein
MPKIFPKRFIALLALFFALGGCATLEQQQAAQTEQFLVAAGFKPGTAAELQQDFAGLPPREIVLRQREGRTFYLYADPQNCHCVYVGGPEAYAQYRVLNEARYPGGTFDGGPARSPK